MQSFMMSTVCNFLTPESIVFGNVLDDLDDDEYGPCHRSPPSPSPASIVFGKILEDDDESGRCHRSPPSPTTDDRYHLDAYPRLGLYSDHLDDDGELHSPSMCSPAWSLPSLSSSPSSVGSDLAHDRSPSPPATNFDISKLLLQSPPSPSTSVAPYHSYFDVFSSPIPCSPRSRALDLPPLESEEDNGLGLSQPSYMSSYSPTGIQIDRDPLGFPQRSKWLSLPGADTDDDLIPLDLASNNYVSDPGLAVPTAPLSRSLLIWDPSTRSGLPASLPTFDRASSGNRLDAVDLLLGRPPSPDDDFEVDPVLLAGFAEKDTEKWVEIQKLCELKQRMTMTAASRNWRDGEGVQIEAERVKERFREVTALLRLKLTQDEMKLKESDVDRDAVKASPNVSAPGRDKLIGQWSVSDAGLFGSPFAPSLLTCASEEASSTGASNSVPVSSTSSPVRSETWPKSPPSPGSHSNEMASSPAARVIQRRTSKPKFTNMAQLVANMVLHRQQDAIRRSPARSRTLSPSSCSVGNAGPTKKKSWIQTSPTSPLRQMTLPEESSEETDGTGPENGEGGVVACDSPLQLSPLCLTLSGSPERFYAQLDSPDSSQPFM